MEINVMSNITKEQLNDLISLQKIVNDSVRIETILYDVSGKIDELDSKLSEFEKSYEEDIFKLKEFNKHYKECEEACEDNNIRIKKSEEYIRTVSNNEDYKILLREIDENKKRNSGLEDEMIEALEKIEEFQKIIDSKKNNFQQLKSQTKSEKKNILDESVEERQELEIIQAKRTKISETINPEILKRYNSILKYSKNAIVYVDKEICSGCFNKIPPQLFIELGKSDKMNFCPQCQRIIYRKKKEKTE